MSEKVPTKRSYSPQVVVVETRKFLVTPEQMTRLMNGNTFSAVVKAKPVAVSYDVAIEQVEQKTFICDLCDNARFSTTQGLALHRLRKHGEHGSKSKGKRRSQRTTVPHREPASEAVVASEPVNVSTFDMRVSSSS